MKRSLAFTLASYIFFLIAFSSEGSAQMFQGKIVEEFSLEPVPAAIVLLHKKDSTIVGYTTTDGRGKYTLKASKPGYYYLSVRKMDYTQTMGGPFRIQEDDTANIELRVISSPETMDAIVVEGEQIFTKLEDNGFYQRKRSRPGSNYLTREDIYKFGSVPPTTVLRSIGGISVIGGKIMNDRFSSQCIMNIYVDNIPLNNDAAAGADLNIPLDMLIPSTDDIIAIEVSKSRPIYRGGVSSRLSNGRLNCGVVQIWTNSL